MIYRVEKLLDGYSTCFRQWQVEHSHCKYLHGYALQFKLYFESSNLDNYGWVWDFGWLKNSKYKIDKMTAANWFDYMFDHTVLIAKDDPSLCEFERLHQLNLIQLRILNGVSCEQVAAFILHKIGNLIDSFTNGKVKLIRVDVMEHQKNCASAAIS
jgi:6-pyruvoyltetrahydropterin/6-carboxytetrahydropterin synthase